MKNIILIFSLMFLSIGHMNAQCCAGASPIPQSNISVGDDRNYADVGVNFSRTKVDDSQPNRLILTAVIENQNGNNSSRETRAIIQLPGEARVLSFSRLNVYPINKAVTFSQCGGILICTIASLDPKSTGSPIHQTEVTIRVITTKPTKIGAECQANFGIHAYSKLPDSYLDNNFWKWHTDAERAIICHQDACSFPDLVVSNTSWNSQTKILTVTVTNSGTTLSGSFLIYVDAEGVIDIDNPICQSVATIQSLDVGASQQLSFDFSNPSCRNGITSLPNSVTKFKVKVDSKDYIKECNENNNVSVVVRN
jgi:CARDB